ncbi:MAG: hypothetical protein ILO34_02885, partial [Kiritimatiellae bacterium]|nr:hypothetical protein [Kiritimatiellia bacterium]
MNIFRRAALAAVSAVACAAIAVGGEYAEIDSTSGPARIVQYGGYTAYVFDSPGEASITVGSGGKADILAVGGGGAGGNVIGGGGGGGQVVIAPAVQLEAGVYAVTVGAGG